MLKLTQFILLFIIASLAFNLDAKENGNEYLVKFKGDSKSRVTINSFFTQKTNGVRKLIKNFESINLKLISLGTKDLSQFKKQFGESIAYIEKNQVIQLDEPIENILIPQPQDQWGLFAINTPKAWNITTGSKKIVVGVIDTGVDYNHYALEMNMWSNKDGEHGYDWVNNDNDPMDDNGHGTHCAGVVGGHSFDIMGVAPNVQIMALKFLSGQGSGTLADAISAIEYGVENGADILSNSWGGGGYSQALKDAIEYALDNDVLFVAAAGNEYNNNDTYPSYPASYKVDNVISVGAMTSDLTKAYFSNYGKESVHVFAPGVNVISSFPNNERKSLSGTSMATPFVAGLAVLVKSQNMNIGAIEIKKEILDNSVEIDALFDYSIVGGRIDAYYSVH